MACLVSWANLTLQDVQCNHRRAEERLYAVQLRVDRTECIGCQEEYPVNECAFECWDPVSSSCVTEVECVRKLTACIERVV